MKKFIYKYVVGHSFDKGIVRNVWDRKEFKTQADLFSFLVENKDDIITQRKSIDKHCEGGISMLADNAIEINKQEGKTRKPLYSNDKENGILKRTIIANTYWWMDSQDDVLIGRSENNSNAVFSKSIADALSSKKGAAKVPPIDQHNFSLDGRIGRTLDLYEAPISWRALGVGRTGMTESLFADVQIEQSKNAERYNDYLNDDIDQHSVGLRAVQVQLAVNDPDEYPKEYAVYQKYINKIGNKQAVESQGYFFAMTEAILREYSAVIAGANELTNVVGQPSSDTGKESSNDTQAKAELNQELKKLLNQIKF